MLVVAALAIAAGVPAEVQASQKVSEGASDVSLKVSASSTTATLVYQARGRTWVISACCAVNARVPVSATQPQFQFKVDYAAAAKPGYCGVYDGPRLPWVVAACKAPDGSYWVVQSWPRMLPNYGVAPQGLQGVPELRLSHFSGALPTLTLKTDWAYAGRFDHLYGSLTYRGFPLHGFRTDRYGSPTDKYGVLLYVDTLDSAYGSGWRRENSFVTHKGNGIFCYGFFPHGPHPTGKGKRYRATVQTPGVLPDLFWEGPAPGPYNRARDAAANAEQKRSFSDPVCRPN